MDKLPSFSQILELFAVIIVLGNVIKAIGTIINPLKSVVEKSKKHDELLDNDNKRISNLENGQIVIIKSLNALLGHEITGNSVDKLKSSKTELETFLIERK